MNMKTQQAVLDILDRYLSPPTDDKMVLRKIVEVVDADMIDVFTRDVVFGELFDSVGLCIARKETP